MMIPVVLMVISSFLLNISDNSMRFPEKTFTHDKNDPMNVTANVLPISEGKSEV